MARPAVFLDRDGTVVRDVNYLCSVRRLRLLPGAGRAIRRLNAAGFAVVIATNQSGVARGLLTEADLAEIHAALTRRMSRHGARLDAICYCPHHPQAVLPAYRKRCRCRKPSPGLLVRAARRLDLDLRASFAVGDSTRDIEAGRGAGCRTVLLRPGRAGRRESPPPAGPAPDHVANNLAEAVAWILSQSGTRPWDRASNPHHRKLQRP
jgi:D-glycero-D-manno-heptose 1,7-bisphosphate phosphatase